MVRVKGLAENWLWISTAIGGMAAQIPIKGDDAANDAALAKVRADKQREAGDGHDAMTKVKAGLFDLVILDVDRQTVVERIEIPLDGLSTPTWSPDGIWLRWSPTAWAPKPIRPWARRCAGWPENGLR